MNTNRLTVGSIGHATIRKIDKRLIPVLLLAYIIAYVDRVNIGVAALEMNHQIGLTATVFGFGAAIFSLPFLLGEIPSNLALEKFGARKWLARIMISWGIVAAAMALIVGPYSYVALRLLLGAAESGLFPCVILYFTYWYPPKQRARVISLFMLAIPLAGFFGSPFSAWLLGLNGILGVPGWRWMFVMEGIPAILLGFACLFWLTDNPKSAAWLTSAEKEWLNAQLTADQKEKSPVKTGEVLKIFGNKTVLLLGLVYAGTASMTGPLNVWLPQIIKSFKVTNMETGLLAGIPFGLSAIAMVLCALSSDRTGERVRHIAIPMALSGISLILCMLVHSPFTVFVALTVAICLNGMVRGPLWALCSEWMSPAAAAVGLAAINMLGTISVILGTYLIGYIKDLTGSFYIAMLPVAALAILGAVAVLALGRPPKPEILVVGMEAKA